MGWPRTSAFPTPRILHPCLCLADWCFCSAFQIYQRGAIKKERKLTTLGFLRKRFSIINKKTSKKHSFFILWGEVHVAYSPFPSDRNNYSAKWKLTRVTYNPGNTCSLPYLQPSVLGTISSLGKYTKTLPLPHESKQRLVFRACYIERKSAIIT